MRCKLPVRQSAWKRTSSSHLRAALASSSLVPLPRSVNSTRPVVGLEPTQASKLRISFCRASTISGYAIASSPSTTPTVRNNDGRRAR